MKLEYNIRFEIGTNIVVKYFTQTQSNSLKLFYKKLKKKANEYFPQGTPPEVEEIRQKVKNTNFRILVKVS